MRGLVSGASAVCAGSGVTNVASGFSEGSTRVSEQADKTNTEIKADTAIINTLFLRSRFITVPRTARIRNGTRSASMLHAAKDRAV